MSLFLANANILSLHNIYREASIYNIGRNARSVTFVETVKNSIERTSVNARVLPVWM